MLTMRDILLVRIRRQGQLLRRKPHQRRETDRVAPELLLRRGLLRLAGELLVEKRPVEGAKAEGLDEGVVKVGKVPDGSVISSRQERVGALPRDILTMTVIAETELPGAVDDHTLVVIREPFVIHGLSLFPRFTPQTERRAA